MMPNSSRPTRGQTIEELADAYGIELSIRTTPAQFALSYSYNATRSMVRSNREIKAAQLAYKLGGSAFSLRSYS